MRVTEQLEKRRLAAALPDFMWHPRPPDREQLTVAADTAARLQAFLALLARESLTAFEALDGGVLRDLPCGDPRWLELRPAAAYTQTFASPAVRDWMRRTAAKVGLSVYP